jgi:Flp pilus assembly protein TadD
LADESSAAFQEGSGHARAARWTQAVKAFERALSLRPDWPAAEANLGVALRALGRFEDAIAAYDRALVHWPAELTLIKNRANALGDRAVELRTQERPAEALACLDAGLATVPDDLILQRHRANVLIDLGRHDEAIAQLDVILAIAPDADAFIRKGLTLQRQGQHAEALDAFDHVTDHADARFFRSMSLLALGAFADGWHDFERRWESASLVGLAEGQVTPRLRERLTVAPSRADLAGLRLLIVGEQGVGDVLMFAGCLPDALADGAEVSLVCEPRLRRLFAASFPTVRLADADVDLAGFDHVLAIGSLCAAYRNDAADFPGTPYLKPSDAARAAAKARFGPRTKRLRVGLSWRGGTKLTSASARSVPLAQLADLLAIPDVDFVSLQYGDPGDAGAAGVRVLDPATISDFDDLAATVMEMDLIVSVQTALIHLAGALGAPCRVMVPHVAEWRYGSVGEAMPWYGSVRLVRQDAGRDWAPVIARIAAQIRALAST